MNRREILYKIPAELLFEILKDHCRFGDWTYRNPLFDEAGVMPEDATLMAVAVNDNNHVAFRVQWKGFGESPDYHDLPMDCITDTEKWEAKRKRYEENYSGMLTHKTHAEYRKAIEKNFPEIAPATHPFGRGRV